MQVGLIGLGRMGSNIALHALEKGHRVVGFDVNPEPAERLVRFGLVAARSLKDLTKRLTGPRVVLLYLPHGDPTEAVVSTLQRLLSPHDVIADCGNSHFREAIRRHERAARKNIAFLDVGTSGGMQGARQGACFMVGGPAGAFGMIAPLLRDLAVPGGVAHVGASGAGHFVKLIHNAIEFGMMQALGEGLDLLVRSEYDLDLPQVFDNWSHGSIIRGLLVELMAGSLREHPLERLSSYVEDTREVSWAVAYALEKEAWIPVIAQAELALYRYRDTDATAAKGVALLRHAFGGHPLHKRGT